MSLLTDWRNAVRDRGSLDTSTTAVAMVLSTYMDGAGYAFPSRQTIATGAKLIDPRSADRAIRILEAEGLLTVRRTKGRRTNHYWATVPPDAPLNGAVGCTVEQVNGAFNDPQQCIQAPSTVQPTAPESIESENEGSTADDEKIEKSELLPPAEVSAMLAENGLLPTFGEVPQ